MTPPSDDIRIAVAVLGAGSSRRFGAANKLKAPFRGSMLGLHAVSAIPRSEFANAWIIAADAEQTLHDGWSQAGFDVVGNPRASEGMGTSAALAARLAEEAGADALLIALADMPLVPRAHFAALAKAAREGGSATLAASSGGGSAMPPAIFGRAHFGRLAALGGDTGARALLKSADRITCPPEWLADVDTPEALAALGGS